MAAQKNKDAPRLTEVRNAKVFRDYEVGERFEAGIKLHGTEVKSVRSGKAQISDSFCRIDKGEVWMLGAHIDPYAFGNLQNHEAKRSRKLFLHRRDIRKVEAGEIVEKLFDPRDCRAAAGRFGLRCDG